MAINPKTLVERFYGEVWNRADEAVAREILDPQFSFRGSLGPQRHGHEEFLHYLGAIHAAFADYRCVIDDLVTSDSRAAARMTFTGIHRGGLFGVPATGRVITWVGAAFFTIAQSRVTRLWVIGDVDAVKRQLGAGTTDEFEPAPPVTLRLNGSASKNEVGMAVQPEAFILKVSDDAIADLRERLACTRYPDQAPGAPWAYGTDVGYLQQLVEYWRTAFDWRAEEARLNAFAQYKVPLCGIDLHFLHVAGKGPAPCPLLLLHGWPGSVFEFIELIPRLSDPARFGGDPADAFTVVAPSLPGYGLSFKPGQPRFGVEEIADCVAELMHDALGYPRFAVQGGDWGGITASRLGYAHPDKLIGIQVNLLSVRRDQQTAPDAPQEEKAYAEQLAQWLREETGYQWIQGTRPQTLAFGLTDSPAGLAAWIIEKFRTWSDCGGDVETAFTRDRLLANISFYWFTGAIGSSFWPYYARMHRPWPIPEGRTVDVPTGYAAFPREILRPPRSLAARTYTDIRRWTVMPRGGHFAALEQPEALANEVREFFRPLRD